MFELAVKAKDLQFIHFLKKESTTTDDETFIFSDYIVASSVIATFLLFYLKKSYFLSMVSDRRIDSSKKEDLYTHFSVEKNQRILLFIKRDLMHFFSDHSLFDLEGFHLFRLKHAKDAVEEMMEEAYENYIDASIGSDDIAWFRDLLHTGVSSCDKLYLSVDTSGFHLSFDDHLYRRDPLEDDDEMLSHSILLCPKSFFVYDPEHLLSKEMVIVIKKIFLERVNFYDKEFPVYYD